jgi:hypothetical protein
MLITIRSYVGLSTTTSQRGCAFAVRRNGRCFIPKIVFSVWTSNWRRVRSHDALKNLFHLIPTRKQEVAAVRFLIQGVGVTEVGLLLFVHPLL